MSFVELDLTSGEKYRPGCLGCGSHLAILEPGAFVTSRQSLSALCSCFHELCWIVVAALQNSQPGVSGDTQWLNIDITSSDGDIVI